MPGTPFDRASHPDRHQRTGEGIYGLGHLLNLGKAFLSESALEEQEALPALKLAPFSSNLNRHRR
jgi:hypothetical protein